MVSLFKASCPCGLEQDGLRQGYKTDYKIFRFDIHFCRSCNRLFDCWDEDSIHGRPEQTICPHCDEEPEESYSFRYDFDKVKHPCPRCKQQTMTFTKSGEWADC